MKRKTAILVTEDDLLTDLAFHNVPTSLLIDFSEKIVRPQYGGSITNAIKDLFEKALSEKLAPISTRQLQTCLEM
jgi:hypothetical protein